MDKVKEQRKEIPFKPKLKLEDITHGTIVVDEIGRKSIVSGGIRRDRDEPCWGYFETLERLEERIKKRVYMGYIEGEYIYGVHCHDGSFYKKDKKTSKNNEIYFDILDDKLKEAGL